MQEDGFAFCKAAYRLREGQGLAHRHTAEQRQVWPWGGDLEQVPELASAMGTFSGVGSVF